MTNGTIDIDNRLTSMPYQNSNYNLIHEENNYLPKTHENSPATGGENDDRLD
jgi:hypothetical protein